MDNLSDKLLYIISHPFNLWWSDKSFLCIGMAVLGWGFIAYYIMTHYRDFHPGMEYGSAKWGDVFELNARRKETTGKIRNRRITRNLWVAQDGPKKLSNNNMLVIGGSGTYKTNSIVAPNLLSASANYIVLDVKGELQAKYANYLKSKGYTIRSLNLLDHEKSDRYNPFAYIEKEEDIIHLIEKLIESVNPPEELAKSDPFWTEGPKLYLQSIMFYEWAQAKKDPDRERDRMPSWNNILLLANKELRIKPVDSEINLADTLYQKTPKELTDDEKKELKAFKRMCGNEKSKTELEILMMLREMKYGKLDPAARDYRKLKSGAENTIRSIIIIVNTMLKLFEIESVRRIFEKDEMNLRDFATGVGGTIEKPNPEGRIALFLVVPEEDHDFNFIVSMLYNQAFSILLRMADNDFAYRGGALPIPLEFWLDEFYAGCRPADSDVLLGTVRSRNVSMIVILQSVAQLKVLFPNEKWGTIMDNAQCAVYLGGGPLATSSHQYISEALGKTTIDIVTDSKNGSTGSVNYSKVGVDLMSPDQVRVMPLEDAIVFLQAEHPIYDQKALPWELSDDDVPFKTALSMGLYKHPVKVVRDSNGEMHTIREAEDESEGNEYRSNSDNEDGAGRRGMAENLYWYADEDGDVHIMKYEGYGALFANVYPDKVHDLSDLGLAEMTEEEILNLDIADPCAAEFRRLQENLRAVDELRQP